MRTALGVFVCLVLTLGTAAADKRKPASVQGADEVLAAFERKDEKALKALAKKPSPDPWLVVEELGARGANDAAAAFAKAAPSGKAVAKLSAYVDSQRGKKPDEEARRVFADMRAAGARRDPAAEIKLASGLAGPLDSVLRVRIVSAHGVALLRLRRLDEGAEVLTRAADGAVKLGWLQRAALVVHIAGSEAFKAGRRELAVRMWTRRLALERELGDGLKIAQALLNVCGLQHTMGEARKAVEGYAEVIRLTREFGDEAGLATALSNLGNAHLDLGEFEEALLRQREALALLRKLGAAKSLARTLHNLGCVHEKRAEHSEALKHLREALEIRQRLGAQHGIKESQGVIAQIKMQLGYYGEALALHEQVLIAERALGDQRGAAITLDAMGQAYAKRGDHAEALAKYVEALELKQRLKMRPESSNTLTNMGVVLERVGNYEEARECFRRSLEIKRATEDRSGIARTLISLGMLMQTLGESDVALKHYAESAAIAEAIGDRLSLGVALINTGHAHLGLDNLPEALAASSRARAISRAINDKRAELIALSNMGIVHGKRGDFQQSRTAFEEALKLADVVQSRDATARLHAGLAWLALERGEAAESVAWVKKALAEVVDLGTGLAEGEGAAARESYFDVYDVAYRAALRAGDVPALLLFLEQGRASSLRESLGSRSALERATIPGESLAALNHARGAARIALDAYRRAHRTGSLGAVRSARKQWDDARAVVGRVARQVEREQKRSAAITLGQPDGLSTIQGNLAADEALVYYALAHGEGVALVVRKASARAIALPPSKDIQAAAEALLSGPMSVEAAKVSALRALVIERLELPKDVKRVLVSPMGILGYVPFFLLMPDKEVAYAPSGTTLGLLRQATAARGKRVLAFGDPVYGATARPGATAARAGSLQRLARLPATRKEVEAIGDVRFLGSKASEAQLDEVLGTQERWRAVHFACHGLVHAERPQLSALALTPDAENDGFLSALEIMRKKIPSDLALLSACETGKGRLYLTEGILGLTRAFMFAGAPRVICSLWKVDDEATQALMVKFYELWNPKEGKGVGAAAALKQAQAFVRGHEKWKHPYYWAAWVLWGLPE